MTSVLTKSKVNTRQRPSASRQFLCDTSIDVQSIGSEHYRQRPSGRPYELWALSGIQYRAVFTSNLAGADLKCPARPRLSRAGYAERPTDVFEALPLSTLWSTASYQA